MKTNQAKIEIVCDHCKKRVRDDQIWVNVQVVNGWVFMHNHCFKKLNKQPENKMKPKNKPKPKKCTCNLCTSIHSIQTIAKVGKTLTEPDVKNLMKLWGDYYQLLQDLDQADCMLHGCWPGWEWIVEEKAKRGLK